MALKVMLLFHLYLLPIVFLLVGIRNKNRKLLIAGLVSLIYLLISFTLDWIF